MNILELYKDYNIPIAPEEHKHSHPDWIHTACPFCTGNPGYHLGYSLEQDYFRCWRCGWHPLLTTISTLLNEPEPVARKLLRAYGGRLYLSSSRRGQAGEDASLAAKPFQFPTSSGPLKIQHKKYLEGRRFDSERLEREWGLLGTGPVSSLDGRDYRHRILAPIIWDGQPVSFQGRSISERASEKYKACPKDREAMHHRRVLYGKPRLWDRECGICVEGITDVWRFGPLAFATFGIQYSTAQANLMAKIFSRVVVVFDSDIQARVQSEKLVWDLRFQGIKAIEVNIQGDPGDMEQEEINNLLKYIKGGKK